MPYPKSKLKKPAPPPPTKKQIPISVKKFTIAAWTGAGEGEKVIVYGVTGRGKTSLCRLLPNSVFVGADPGGSKIRNLDGTPLNYISGIETFQDVRDVFHSNMLFEPVENIIVETITDVEQWGLVHTLATVPKPKSQGGGPATNVHDYGYHEGFSHWCDTMSLLLPDFDRWIRKGKNVILTAQETTIKWKTSGVEDFLMSAPELHHSRTASTLLAYLRWADHIFRIDYANTFVKDGRASPTKERAIFTEGDATFFAESRTIPAEFSVVEFKSPEDDSIWRLLFNKEK